MPAMRISATVVENILKGTEKGDVTDKVTDKVTNKVTDKVTDNQHKIISAIRQNQWNIITFCIFACKTIHYPTRVGI